jgi:hypothetical protein
MFRDTAYTRTFRRATETVGGVEPLANAIGAPVAQIEAWNAGLKDPPPDAFLKALDIVARPGLYGRRVAKS